MCMLFYLYWKILNTPAHQAWRTATNMCLCIWERKKMKGCFYMYEREREKELVSMYINICVCFRMLSSTCAWGASTSVQHVCFGQGWVHGAGDSESFNSSHTHRPIPHTHTHPSNKVHDHGCNNRSNYGSTSTTTVIIRAWTLDTVGDRPELSHYCYLS